MKTLPFFQNKFYNNKFWSSKHKNNWIPQPGTLCYLTEQTDEGKKWAIR